MFKDQSKPAAALSRMSAVAAAAALGATCLWTGVTLAQTGAGAPTGLQQGQPMAGQQGQQGQQGQLGQHGQQARQGQQGDGTDQPLTKQLPDRYQVSNWLGKSVKNRDGKELGSVKELVMDDMGRLRFVILQSQLLADNKAGDQVAVPVGHFVYPLAREEHLVFDVSPDQVQKAPAFGATGGAPNMGQPQVSRVIIAYWLPEDAQQQAQAGEQGEQQDRQAEQQGDQQGQQAQQQAGQQGRQAGQQSQQQAGTGMFDPNRDMVYLPPEKTRLFERLDRNNDGIISREEAEQHDELKQRFDEVDSYGNERITRSEFAAFEIQDDSGRSGQQDEEKQRQEDGESRSK
jgi:hypothetical protein